jgi:hypothetical protein
MRVDAIRSDAGAGQSPGRPRPPFEYGHILTEAIPGAIFRELTAKSVSPEQHAADVQPHIEAFLKAHFGGHG